MGLNKENNETEKRRKELRLYKAKKEV